MPSLSTRPLTVAVVGATGVVGGTMIRMLLEREFPVGELRLLASGRSAGRTVDVDGVAHTVQRGDPRGVRGRRHRAVQRRRRHVQGPGPGGGPPGRDRHRQLVRLADGPERPARRQPGQPRRPRGARGHHRQPELLDDAARAGPHGPARRRRAGAGRRGHLPGGQRHRAARPSPSSRARSRPTSPSSRSKPRVYPHQIAFNALPQVDVFLDNGYTKEEWKVVTESRKILHLPDLRVSSTAVRVPVFVAHSEAVHVETRGPITPDRARTLFAAVPGRRGPGRPVDHRPTRSRPRRPARDEIYVGRVRQDPSIADGRGLAFWVVSDNLRKGAATNAVQLAETPGRARLGQGRRGTERGRNDGVTDAERRAALEGIAAEVRVCTRCRLHETRTKAVPGEGDPSTEVVFVGEGPGQNEDREGRPFVGRAGGLLVNLLGHIGWSARTCSSPTSSSAGRPATATPSPTRSPPARRTSQRQLEVARSGPGRHPRPLLDGAVHARRAHLAGPRHHPPRRPGDRRPRRDRVRDVPPGGRAAHAGHRARELRATWRASRPCSTEARERAATDASASGGPRRPRRTRDRRPPASRDRHARPRRRATRNRPTQLF